MICRTWQLIRDAFEAQWDRSSIDHPAFLPYSHDLKLNQWLLGNLWEDYQGVTSATRKWNFGKM
jgi:hypothetical protein